MRVLGLRAAGRGDERATEAEAQIAGAAQVLRRDCAGGNQLWRRRSDHGANSATPQQASRAGDYGTSINIEGAPAMTSEARLREALAAFDALSVENLPAYGDWVTMPIEQYMRLKAAMAEL